MANLSTGQQVNLRPITVGDLIAQEQWQLKGMGDFERSLKMIVRLSNLSDAEVEKLDMADLEALSEDMNSEAGTSDPSLEKVVFRRMLAGDLLAVERQSKKREMGEIEKTAKLMERLSEEPNKLTYPQILKFNQQDLETLSGKLEAATSSSTDLGN